MFKSLGIILILFMEVKAKTLEPFFEIHTKEDKKAVLINQKTLFQIKKTEFPEGEYKIQTLQSSLFINFKNNFKIKIFPESELEMKTAGRVDGKIEFNLKKGKVYFKQIPRSTGIKIENLFDFNLAEGDFMVEFNNSTKNTTFVAFVKDQTLQIASDDRTNVLKKNFKIDYILEWSDGEIVYDFLLNDKKIPRFQLHQELADMTMQLKDDEWKIGSKKSAQKKSKKNSKGESKEALSEILTTEEIQAKILEKKICNHPRGSYSQCYWVNQGNHCVRFFCNLNGEWGQKTEFQMNKECPSVPKITSCDWIN